MSAVLSRDGTTVAFDRSGSGPAVVLVDGAMCSRTSGPMPALARELAPSCAVYTYDRRGRGDSGDTAPYAVAREVEDLAAVIEEAGGSAYVYGISSGAALVLEAAASGLPIIKLALYDPAFTAEAGDPQEKKAYSHRLGELLAAGRRGDAVELFLTTVGVPPQAVAAMRQQPVWALSEAIAPTLGYDDAVLGDGTVPREKAARVAVPVLVLDGEASPAPLRHASTATAEALPHGRHQTLSGQGHDVAPEALAPVLREFFR